MRKTYSLGEKVFYKDKRYAGIVVGCRETYWSDDQHSEVNYRIRLENGRERNVPGSELLDVPNEK
ncbi:MAG: hypothetical protein CMO97_05150 [Woeseia sp.]|nr:hypothetical protein [Woeseia sp.]|tara:strand:+ start:387 stop:581 length:195 start_codon:yes stop_codon:yes gene_type:complete